MGTLQIVMVLGAALFVLLLAVAIVGLIYGFTIVEDPYIAVVRFLGKAYKVWLAGPHFLFPVLMKMTLFTTTTHQIELPAEKKDIESGKESPYRIKHKGYQDAKFYRKKPDGDTSVKDDDPRTWYTTLHYENLPEAEKERLQHDPAHSALTGEWTIGLEWGLIRENIKQAAINFYLNVNPVKGRDREEEVEKRMADAVGKVLEEYLAPTTFGHAKDMIAFFNTLIKWRLEIEVGERKDPAKIEEPREPVDGEGAKDITADEQPWGIHIHDAGLQPPSMGHRVNIALAEAAAQVSRRQQEILSSEGRAKSIENEANAQANATRATANAEKYALEQVAEGRKKLIEEVGQALVANPKGEIALQIDAAMKILPSAKLVVVDAATGSGLMGVIGAVSKAASDSRNA